MWKSITGIMAAGAIAAGALSIAMPAQAAQFGVYVGPTYQHSCRHWSERLQAWVWTCPRAYHENYNQDPPIGFQFDTGGDQRHYHH